MKDVLIITGPTASGKTRLAHLIAKSSEGEVIAADSMKVYRGADIGTAKPSRKYQKEVRYHLLDIIDPDQRYDVGSFYSDARIIIDGLHHNDILPVVAGGTPLYVTKLIEGLAEIPKLPDNIKNELENKPTDLLYRELMKIDPDRSKDLHPNMRRRIIRAVGVYMLTGKKMSELLLTTEKVPYNFILLGIKWKREVLYNRINKRVDKMIQDGLIDEVKDFYEKYSPDSPIFEGVGYRQVTAYLKGKINLEKAVEEIKKATRNYAKTQLTWWRNKNLFWLDGEKLKCGINL